MIHTNYLIIGGGMTGAAAAGGIRELDANGRIVMISAESAPPYDRPPLSKKLWTGKSTVRDIAAPLPDDVELRLGRRVVALDPARREATDSGGITYTYDKVLLATGGAPRRLPFGGGAVNYYRQIYASLALHREDETRARVVVIGGGFIGSEVASSLRQRGNEVTLVFPENGICDRIFPPDLAADLIDYYRQHGVVVHSGEKVTDIESYGDGTAVITGSGLTLPADRVVAGIGIIPSVELAEQAGLAVDNGIVVDDYLRAGRPDIYAAGDVANYPDAVLGKRRRVEHADAARASGKAAGRNMAGAGEPYDYLPMFYSDLFDLGYEAVGELDSRMEMIEDWQERFSHGAIYYLRDGRVRGVLLMDIWDRLDEARELIRSGETHTAESLRGRFE